MAKHRRDDRIVPVSSFEELSPGIVSLSREHFERDVLSKIFDNMRDSNLRKYGKDGTHTTRYYVYENYQFGETNAFVLFHTEEDKEKNTVGWIDFVMVKNSNRAEGIGSSLTELAIDYLQDKGAIVIFTSLLLPVSHDGEEGFPAYGSRERLEDWGFSEMDRDGKNKHFSIDGERYDQLVFLLI